MTFTDAEARIYEELGATIRGEFLVTGIARTDIHDIFAYDDADTWYKCKVSYDKIDDEADKKKTITQNFLVSATNVKESYERIVESLSTLMIDFQITSIIASPIVEIFPYREDEIEAPKKKIQPIIEHEPQAIGKIFSASGSDFEDFEEDSDENDEPQEDESEISDEYTDSDEA
jgi:hypothetical protein